jgi:catechol 2,3-dioxygenase-like lactoylglutathione lyase family enzyme
MQIMKIGFVRVFVTDFDKSLDFYTKTLGMEIDYTDKTSWAQFKSGEDVSLAIEKCDHDHVEQGSKMVGRFVGVTLMVDNIEDQYNRLVAKGVEFTGRPEKQHWGGTLAHLKDLDGNVLTLMQEAT